MSNDLIAFLILLLTFLFFLINLINLIKLDKLAEKLPENFKDKLDFSGNTFLIYLITSSIFVMKAIADFINALKN